MDRILLMGAFMLAFMGIPALLAITGYVLVDLHNEVLMPYIRRRVALKNAQQELKIAEIRRKTNNIKNKNF